MRAAILEQNQKQGIPSPRAEHKAKLLALGILSGNGPNLLAEMLAHARASGLKRAAPCHVCLSSDRTASAEPLLWIAWNDAQLGWHVPEALRWAWRNINSRDASKIRRGGRASGLKCATPCHVCLSSDRTARAEPLLLSGVLDVWQAGDAIGAASQPAGDASLSRRTPSDDGLLHLERCDDRSLELVRLADVPGSDSFAEGQLLGLELATELRALALRVSDRRDAR
jgi:hypothetical protein